MTGNAPAIAPITRDEAAAWNPSQPAPPLLTDDGHTQAVGEAHGRILPLIGGVRPYLYDVAFDGTRRVYADTINEAMALVLGGRYRDLAAQLIELDATLPPAPPAPYEGAVDEIDALLMGDGPTASPPATADDLAAFDTYRSAVEARNRVLYEMALIRRQHADLTRVTLQAKINADARASGGWDQLSEKETAELTAAADPAGTSPAGIIEEVPIVTNGGGSNIERGVWMADTRLVVNTGDYTPWTSIPFPHSGLIRPDDDGQECEVPTRSNLVILDIDTDEDYLQSLADTGVVKLRVWPDEQPDEVFRGLTITPGAGTEPGAGTVAERQE
jgi:hypothetical protein